MSAPKPSRSLLGPSLANLHGQYNFQSIAIVLIIMREMYPQTGWEEAVLTCIVFVGAINGQIVFGYVGDWMGRHKALVLTNSLCFLGAVGSAVLPHGEEAGPVYTIIAICRFFLGFGVGGLYPLSAINAAEHSGSDDILKRRTRVSLAFFWQVPGSTLPFLVAWAVSELAPDNVQLQFRVVLGLGALPAFICVLLSVRESDSKEYQVARHSTESGLSSSLRKREYWVKLIGTGGGWFCYDICHYGPYLLAPVIVADIFNANGVQTVAQTSWQTAFANMMGIPGVLVCIALYKPLGTRNQQLYGFLFIAASFFAMAYVYQTGQHENTTLLFALFCVMTFAINSGPSVTTYLLPSESFPPEVRGTFNGLSAAMGKCGAAMATFADFLMYDKYGIEFNLAVYGAVAIVGALITLCFVDDDYISNRVVFTKVRLSEDQRATKQTATKYTEFI